MSDFKIVFVWNRTADKMRGIVPEEVILQDLAHCASRCAICFLFFVLSVWFAAACIMSMF